MKTRHYSRRYTWVLFFAAFCAVLLMRSSASSQYLAEMEVRLSSFRPNETVEASRYRLRDGDVIMVTQETRRSIPSNEVEVVLQTASGVTWWKEIKLTKGTLLGPDHYDVTERITVKAASTQDSVHGPTRPIRFSIREMTDAHGGIVFSKAKFLGAHTEVYYLPAFYIIGENVGGKRLTFTWQVD